MIWKLFLDDERFPPNSETDWQLARTYSEAVELISRLGMPSYISFDHDLGDPQSNTGYDLAKYIVSP